MRRILSSFALALMVAPAFGAETTKPNILFIAVDDLKPMLGCYGDPDIKTPNMDRLAKRGTVFLNNSCQQAVCGPSRASLMTGTYPDTTRVFDLKTLMRVANTNTLTLPEHLRKFGYETTGVGKIYDPRSVEGGTFDAASWSQPFLQNGDDNLFAKGFEKPQGEYQAEGTRKAIREMRAYLKEKGINRIGEQVDGEVAKKFPNAKPPTECLDVPDDAYHDGMFASVALDQMERLAKGGKPFFLAVGFKKPHLPFVAPKKYWDLYDRTKIVPAAFQKMPEGAPSFAFQDSWELRGGYTGVPAGLFPTDMQLELIHGYRATVSYTDAQIGKLLDKLEALGLADNTIIVLWGDHGWHLGDHGMFCKHSNYEQAVRSPLIIAAPGQKAKGAKAASATEFVDVFPTLCDLIGVAIPKRVEGRSLVSLLNDPKASVREAGMEQYPRGDDKMGYTLRDARYRYVKWVKLDFYKGERTGTVEARELYDYEKDPLETVNLAHRADSKEVIAKFERLFKERGVAQEK